MRISDWSSDVCSSDVTGIRSIFRFLLGVATGLEVLDVGVSGGAFMLLHFQLVTGTDRGRRRGLRHLIERLGIVRVGRQRQKQSCRKRRESQGNGMLNGRSPGTRG